MDENDRQSGFIYFLGKQHTFLSISQKSPNCCLLESKYVNVYMRRECVQLAGEEFAAFPDGAVQGRFITYSKVLDFINLFELAPMDPRVLRLTGKHACIQKRENKMHIHTHRQTFFFPFVFTN